MMIDGRNISRTYVFAARPPDINLAVKHCGWLSAENKIYEIVTSMFYINANRKHALCVRSQ